MAKNKREKQGEIENRRTWGPHAQAPNAFNRLVLMVKNLDATVAELADKQASLVVQHNVVRIT